MELRRFDYQPEHAPPVLTPVAQLMLADGTAFDSLSMNFDKFKAEKDWGQHDSQFGVLLGYDIQRTMKDALLDAPKETFLRPLYNSWQTGKEIKPYTSIGFTTLLSEVIRENRGKMPDVFYFANEIMRGYLLYAVDSLLKQMLEPAYWKLWQPVVDRATRRMGEIADVLYPDDEQRIIEYTDSSGYGYSLTVEGRLEDVSAHCIKHFPQYSMHFLEHGAYFQHPDQWVLFNYDGEVSYTKDNDIDYNYVDATREMREFQADVLHHYRNRKLNLLIE